MKGRISRLNLRNVDYKVFIVETRRHWWSRWKYVIDEDTGCPRLFFGTQKVYDFIIKNDIEML